MKIVFLDAATMGEVSFAPIERLGSLICYDSSTPEEALVRVSDCDVLIVNKVKVTPELIDAASNLKLICESATGVNNIDIDYAAKKGIPVRNAVGYSTTTVVQATFMHILSLVGHAPYYDSVVKDGTYSSSGMFTDVTVNWWELAGKTIGIFGFGRIGRAVAERAKAFGMNVIAYTPRLYGNEPDFVKFVTLDEMLKTADAISMHCPLTPETEGLVNEEFIAKMKDGAYFINTSRGTVVNEKALADALNSGKLGGAGLDVLSCEPPKADNPLLSAKNCFITPHIAWAAFETRERLVGILEENIKAFISGKPQNVINS